MLFFSLSPCSSQSGTCNVQCIPRITSSRIPQQNIPKRRRDADNGWVHQDLKSSTHYYSPNSTSFFEAEDAVPDLWMTQPISLQKPADPMRPFLPAYPVAKASPGLLLGLGMAPAPPPSRPAAAHHGQQQQQQQHGLSAGVILAPPSNRVQPSSGFIMPAHIR